MGLLYKLIGISVFYGLIYELVVLHISGNTSFSGNLYETSCFTRVFKVEDPRMNISKDKGYE